MNWERAIGWGREYTIKTALLYCLAGIALSACSTTGMHSNKLANGCKQKYTQVYQPPLKIGGAGRVINIPSGYDCPTPTVTKQSDIPSKAEQPYMRTVKFNSLPAGAIVTVHTGSGLGAILDKTSKPLGGCTTPCSMQVDGRTSLFALGEMDKGKMELLPLAINSREEKGVELYFSRAQPIEVRLSTLSASRTPTNAEDAIYDKNARPLVRPPPVFPIIAKRSGSCDMVFDVTEQGVPTNIRAKSCDNYAFTPASIASVAKWIYNSEFKDGKPVMRKGVEDKITFKLVGKNGKIIH